MFFVCCVVVGMFWKVLQEKKDIVSISGQIMMCFDEKRMEFVVFLCCFDDVAFE